MSTLAEFLLARIAEDEAPTWALVPYSCEPHCCAPAGWAGSQCRYCDGAPVYGGTVAAITQSAEEHAEQVHQRSRVLAECESKRRIVEGWKRLEREDYTGYVVGGGWDPGVGYAGDALDYAMRCLALPYASHPDYRDEWKP